MYSVLIVDDERMIRNGLRDLIPWASLGFSKVFTAAKAEEAIHILGSEKIDLMLTDICMPETTGIQLVRQLENNHPQLRTIVLTGYNDFEYAQQCCRLEVHDFLLKPINEDELIEAVRRQREELKRVRMNKQQNKAKSRVIEMGDALRLENTLRNLAHGEACLDKTEEILAQYGYPHQHSVQLALVIPQLREGQNRIEENQLRILSIKHLCLEMVDAQKAGITFEDREGKLGIVFFVEDSLNGTYNQLEQISGRLRDEMEAVPKILLGSVVKNMGELAISYNDALYLLAETHINPSGSVYQSKQMEKKMLAFIAALENAKALLFSNLGDEENVIHCMQLIGQIAGEYNPSQKLLRRCCLEISSSAYLTFLQENSSEIDDRITTLMQVLCSCEREKLLPVTQNFIFNLFPQDPSSRHEVIAQAKQYINQNLKENLSVAHIANQLFMNANYFSRLFKQMTQEGCNEYITRKRIERAKALLESSSLKTGQIAEAVGYKDKNYFSLAFKKQTGLAPTTYRAEVRGAKNPEIALPLPEKAPI